MTDRMKITNLTSREIVSPPGVLVRDLGDVPDDTREPATSKAQAPRPEGVRFARGVRNACLLSVSSWGAVGVAVWWIASFASR